MSICIPYKSAPFSPYEDWVKRGKTENVVFRYSQGQPHVNYADYLFLPHLNLLKIKVSFDVYGFHATARVKVHEQERFIEITEATSRGWRWRVDSKFRTHNAPKCVGGTQVLKELLLHYNRFRIYNRELRICDTIATKLFGDGWKISLLPEADKYVPDEDVQAMEEMLTHSMMNQYEYKCKYAYAFYDYRKLEAAIKIQAAYRGWRVRMRYRYNPHTCLGRFLVLREAGFI